MLGSGVAQVSLAAFVTFLTTAHYTKRVQVTGILMPDAGLVNVQPQQAGLVLERRVREGQTVRAGEVLFVLSSELQVQAQGRQTGSNDAILHTLRQRQDSVDAERAQAAKLSAQQTAQWQRTAASLERELAQLGQEIATQQARVESARAQYQRNVQMQGQGFMSRQALQQTNDDLLEQQGRLQGMQRSSLSLSRELANAQAELVTLAARDAREQTQLGRQVLELEQQTLSAEARRQFLVTAPQAGIVTAILADLGQRVTGQTLLTIQPAGAPLEAQLYVPSRSVGFIERGQPVSIRYAAFPFQKFGQYQGQVLDVSRSALMPQDLPQQLFGGAGAAREGMYRVRVSLQRQAITAYGRAQPLSAGMQLDADILQDRRTLLEWLLEPVYSLKGMV